MARVSKSNCTKHLSWAFWGSWDVEKCMELWREARLEVKMLKTPQPGALLEVKMFKKCTPFWREAHFEVKMCKTHHGRTTFASSSVVLCGRRYGFCTLSKVTQTWVLQQLQKRCRAWNVWSSAKVHFAWQAQYKWHLYQRCWEVPERGCILEHQIFRFAK